MMEISVHRDRLYKFQSFTAFRDGKPCGELIVYKEGSLWMIEEIHVWPRRKGIGTALLKEFSAFVGGKQVIKACVIHRPTIREIRRNSLLPDMVTDKFVIEDPEKLSLLPITKLFKQAGIDATALEFSRSVTKTREKDILAFYDVYLLGMIETPGVAERASI